MGSADINSLKQQIAQLEVQEKDLDAAHRRAEERLADVQWRLAGLRSELKRAMINTK